MLQRDFACRSSWAFELVSTPGVSHLMAGSEISLRVGILVGKISTLELTETQEASARKVSGVQERT